MRIQGMSSSRTWTPTLAVRVHPLKTQTIVASLHNNVDGSSILLYIQPDRANDIGHKETLQTVVHDYSHRADRRAGVLH